MWLPGIIIKLQWLFEFERMGKEIEVKVVVVARGWVKGEKEED